LVGSIYTTRENTAALVVATETGVEVSAEKTKYVVMSRDQNAGQNGNIKLENRSFKRIQDRTPSMPTVSVPFLNKTGFPLAVRKIKDTSGAEGGSYRMAYRPNSFTGNERCHMHQE
jgi:hypothetical protein